MGQIVLTNGAIGLKRKAKMREFSQVRMNINLVLKTTPADALCFCDF